jgi:DNA-binding transcriptional LysR family regulator
MHAMHSAVSEDTAPATVAVPSTATVDFNLLVTLDALLQERSVSGAARRLHLTESAVSRALGRIRRATDDPILVRAGNTMVPTPRALDIHAEVHELVQRTHAVFVPFREPDLATLERTFAILGQDALVTAIGVGLLERLAREAPKVRIRFLPEPTQSDDPLRDGTADLEIGGIDSTAPEIRSEVLGEETAVAVVRAGHPLTEGPLTPRRFSDARHVTVSPLGRLRGPVDTALAAIGLHRVVAASVTSYAAAFTLIAHSDLVGLAPRRIGRHHLASLGLVTLETGLNLPALAICQAWHPRYDADGPHRWLRGCVRDAIRDALTPDT